MARLLLALMVLLNTGYVSAQAYYMNIRMRGGGSTSIPIAEIQKLTFGPCTTVQGEKLVNVVRTFTLLQNYPNPSNPSTTIEYQLPNHGDVQITIFNINGQQIRTLERSHQVPGMHKVVWNGTNDIGQSVSSGPYIYRVIFDHSMLSKKMLFIK